MVAFFTGKEEMGLVPGDTLQGDKYRIEKWLRSGLTTVSYLAKRSNGSRWVIKVLDPQVLVSLSDEERNRAETLFIQEAVKLERCSGTPHIVRKRRHCCSWFAANRLTG